MNNITDPRLWRAAKSPLQNVLQDARWFITDINDHIDSDIMDDVYVMHFIMENCVGGWHGFVVSDPDVNPQAIRAEMEHTYGASFTYRIYGDWDTD